MMEEMFLWSAICSANTTNATGTYATAIVPRYAGLNSAKPPRAVRKVNSGSAMKVESETPSAQSAVK